MFVVLIFHAYQEPTYVSFTLVVLASVVLTAVTLIRLFALRLQNRIIRLEMQVRLSRFGREQDLARLALRRSSRCVSPQTPSSRHSSTERSPKT